jgi:hypothetical protein
MMHNRIAVLKKMRSKSKAVNRPAALGIPRRKNDKASRGRVNKNPQTKPSNLLGCALFVFFGAWVDFED